MPFPEECSKDPWATGSSRPYLARVFQYRLDVLPEVLCLCGIRGAASKLALPPSVKGNVWQGPYSFSFGPVHHAIHTDLQQQPDLKAQRTIRSEGTAKVQAKRTLKYYRIS